MLKVYFVLFILFLILLIIASIRKLIGAKTIRFFGFELFRLLTVVLLISLLAAVFILPIPQYYIKGNGMLPSSDEAAAFSLNKILEREAKKAGIEFDEGSFQILDSYGMNLHHLFLCSYRVDGGEDVRVFQFEKNIFGNMKPREPLNKSYILQKSSNVDDYYHDYISDGIFGGYLVTAGYAAKNTVLKNYQLNHFYIEQLHPSGYFLWVELADTPWKKYLIQLSLLMAIVLIRNLVMGQKGRTAHMNTAFYSRWSPGQNVLQFIDDNQSDYEIGNKEM